MRSLAGDGVLADAFFIPLSPPIPPKGDLLGCHLLKFQQCNTFPASWGHGQSYTSITTPSTTVHNTWILTTDSISFSALFLRQ